MADDNEEKAAKLLKESKDQFAGVQWWTPGMGWQITYKGVYSHDALYKAVFMFLQKEEYKGLPEVNKPGTPGTDENYEIHYEDRNAGGFQEVWHKWRAKKIVEGECEFYIQWNAHLIGLKKQDVMVHDQKVPAHNVELDTWFRAGIRWISPGSDGPKVLQDVFGPNGEKLYQRFYFRDRERLERDAYDDMLELFDTVKQILGLPTHTEVRGWAIGRRGYPMFNTDAPNYEPHPDN